MNPVAGITVVAATVPFVPAQRLRGSDIGLYEGMKTAMRSYDYEHRTGVEMINWNRFDQLCKTLAEQLAARKVEAIIGIARAGLFPAVFLAYALRVELYPVRLTRRVNDEVKYTHPVWKVDVPADVEGQVVAVVDEIADTGETLAIAAERVKERGALEVVTVSLVSHSWAKPKPDLTALVSDALVLFPWGREVYDQKEWRPNPELAHALKLQERNPKTQAKKWQE